MIRGFISRIQRSTFLLNSNRTACIVQNRIPAPIQKAGCGLLAASLISAVAALQGLVAIYKYRYDARGRLQYPDGLTLGQEDISSDESEAESNDTTTVEKLVETANNDEDEEVSLSSYIIDSCLHIMLDGNNCFDNGATSTSGNTNQSVIPSLFKKMITSRRELTPIRVVVIGDSLAVGVGCIEQFKATEDTLMSLIENTRVDNNSNTTSPVFPQALARTLSLHFKRPVHWRSAGVDGGDIRDIREFCIDIVEHESTRDSTTIDIVVVIFGMNDLKKLLTNWDGGVSQFRQGMERLISDIRSHAPGALVVFPQIPIQTNVFPLSLFLDGTLAVLERIKRLVANSKSNSMYLGLKNEELLGLFRRHRSSQSMSTSELSNHLVDEHGIGVGGDLHPEDTIVTEQAIVSPDNVHPNKRTYAKWAELVGNQLHTRVTSKVEQMRRGKGKSLD